MQRKLTHKMQKFSLFMGHLLKKPHHKFEFVLRSDDRLGDIWHGGRARPSPGWVWAVILTEGCNRGCGLENLEKIGECKVDRW